MGEYLGIISLSYAVMVGNTHIHIYEHFSIQEQPIHIPLSFSYAMGAKLLLGMGKLACLHERLRSIFSGA